MTEPLLAAPLRMTVFPGVPAAMAGWDLAAARRRQDIPRATRRTRKLELVAVDTVTLCFSDRPTLIRHPVDRP